MPVGPAVPDVDQIIPPTYNSSGLVVTSGTPGVSSFDGAWFVEEQGMKINYNRVPVGSLSAFDITLANSTITHKNNSSQLVCVVEAYYKSYKDWANYQTSAWQQPQKFEFISFSADPNGNSYGPLNASTLGPMGTIVTNQPYYNRRLWSDASGDAEVFRQTNAATYYAVKDPEYAFSSTIDPTPYASEFEYWWIDRDRRGSLLNDWDVKVRCGWHYNIPGVYATSQENLWQIFYLLDQVGNEVEYSDLYAIPANTIGTGSANGVIGDQGFPEYKTSRHDYS